MIPWAAFLAFTPLTTRNRGCLQNGKEEGERFGSQNRLWARQPGVGGDTLPLFLSYTRSWFCLAACVLQMLYLWERRLKWPVRSFPVRTSILWRFMMLLFLWLRLLRMLTVVLLSGLRACTCCVRRYFRMDSSAAQFHLEIHENTSGVWTMWYLNHFDRSVVINDVFVSKEAKHFLKVHMVFSSRF